MTEEPPSNEPVSLCRVRMVESAHTELGVHMDLVQPWASRMKSDWRRGLSKRPLNARLSVAHRIPRYSYCAGCL